ncbi:metal ABC transporter solute-binding protein, Zn/Mn family [Roseococcus pinisoli]|uniref:Zinc ABC transporter substrate-binding protein n=1 Tax=Roseococcus pinisoli TaxID=2835040 RepID=A0ABS5QJQ9_9PROT|nr:zinc ABC transporter substrate-binding protein [Roseococcus pinisoli]MBS7813763.1 zinc ABC transporter substrate-binding protein [Roseococcus pinisoli]
MQRRLLLALAAVLPLRAQAQTAALPAVASFSILGDMLREVGGERVTVQTIAGPDTDTHHFQPRPSHAEALRGARLALRNGAGFDSWFDRLLSSTRFSGVSVSATDGVPLRRATGHSHGGQDPHAWQDVRLALRYVRNIEAGLTRADPAGADHYRARAGAYTAQLEALDAWIRAQIATVPEARRVVVTGHDAFGYFSAAYGVRFLAPQGLSADAEPSARQVADLIRLIRGEGVTAVFLENIGNPATLRRLADEAGLRVGGRLFTDALSPPDGPAATYEAMMRTNVAALVPAMRGDG